MVIEVSEKVKIRYETPKSWNKKKSADKLMSEYLKFNLVELREMKLREADKKLYYSKIQRLENKLERLQAELKLMSEILLKHLDDTTDKRTSFKKWYRRKNIIGEEMLKRKS